VMLEEMDGDDDAGDREDQPVEPALPEGRREGGQENDHRQRDQEEAEAAQGPLPEGPVPGAHEATHLPTMWPPFDAGSGESGHSVGEAGQRYRDADAGLRRLEDDEGRGMPLVELGEQVFVDLDLGNAAVAGAADVGGIADVLAVDLEPEAGRQEDAARDKHP